MGVFVSAFLLFLVQPLFARLLLPHVGGAASVWTAAMLGFQGLLLAGYLLAQRLSRFKVRTALYVHALLSLACVVYLYAVEPTVGDAPQANEVLWILEQQVWLVGAAFVLLSASSPLLQHAYAHAAQGEGEAYRLYQASNLGSFGGLIAYPFAIERMIGVSNQVATWRAGLVCWVFVLFAHALLFRRAPQKRVEPATLSGSATGREGGSPDRVGTRRVLGWITLAFFPSSLMLGVTTYVTSDLSPLPFIWVIPLSLYLLSMVLAFGGRGPGKRTSAVVGMLGAIWALAWATFGGVGWISAFANIVGYAIVAWAMHLALYRSRPAESQLTSFYLWLSVGGIAGGMFNAVIAPQVFDRVAEYHLVLCAAMASFAWLWLRALDNPRRELRAMAGGRLRVRTVVLLTATIGAAFVLISQRGQREEPDVLARDRSFYSSFAVKNDSTRGRTLFVHGNTVHGMMLHASPTRPVGYYTLYGPIDEVFGVVAQRGGEDVGVVGLGCGTLAGYAARFERMDFFEIDPLVRDVASDARLFQYLPACGSKCRVEIGDGRRLLEKLAVPTYDVLVVDAYSSDAIPIHLVTREAMRVYLHTLKEGGLLSFHISNRYVDLVRPLADLASDQGLIALEKSVTEKGFEKGTALPSRWMVMVPDERSAARFEALKWKRVLPSDEDVWTDERSDVIGAYRDFW